MTDLVSPAGSRYPVIQPQLLKRPDVLETISFEDILATRMARFVALWASRDPPNAAQYDVGSTEFDPIKILEENNSFFEITLRDRVNQAARAVMLAFAVGSNLDAIGSRYPYGMPRQAGESDDSYRRRVWLSPNILSPHGVDEAYAFWTLSALGPGVLRDAKAFTTRGTGVVTIAVLLDKPTPAPAVDIASAVLASERTGLKPLTVRWDTAVGDPTPSPAQVLDIYRYVTDRTRKGLTDEVTIARAKVVNTDYNIKIWTLPGYDKVTSLSNAASELFKLIEAQRWLGFDHTILAIDGALNRAGGVYNRQMVEPMDDLVVGNEGFVRVNSLTLSWMGEGE